MKAIELSYSVLEVAPASTMCELVLKSPARVHCIKLSYFFIVLSGFLFSQ